MKAGWRKFAASSPTAVAWGVYGINENGRQAEAYFHP